MIFGTGMLSVFNTLVNMSCSIQCFYTDLCYPLRIPSKENWILETWVRDQWSACTKETENVCQVFQGSSWLISFSCQMKYPCFWCILFGMACISVLQPYELSFTALRLAVISGDQDLESQVGETLLPLASHTASKRRALSIL